MIFNKKKDVICQENVAWTIPWFTMIYGDRRGLGLLDGGIPAETIFLTAKSFASGR